MPSDQLPAKIADLVDLLRKQEHPNHSLADVASVTEVLIATMQSYFKSIDTEIYRECRTMSEYIVNARQEIATLQPKNLEHDRIPRAGQELDAIVQQTETATNTIMESAETIMAADSSDYENYPGIVEENLLKIFEACSFQDITGQRISKVVETLNYVEERVQELRKLLGVTDEDIRNAMNRQEVVEGEQALMRGPSLEGEGIEQDEIDALMTGDDGADVGDDNPGDDAGDDAADVADAAEEADADSASADNNPTGGEEQAGAPDNSRARCGQADQRRREST